MRFIKPLSQRGDTIIEVLIAISIAGLAIGLSYATASRSIGRAITARERDQAVGIMEAQLSRLKAIEQQVGLTSFNATFNDTNAAHFCVTSSAITPVLNHGNLQFDSALSSQPPVPYYDPQCVSGSYFIDIQSVVAPGSKNPKDNYLINVRWVPYQTTGNNQVTIYYRF